MSFVYVNCKIYSGRSAQVCILCKSNDCLNTREGHSSPFAVMFLPAALSITVITTFSLRHGSLPWHRLSWIAGCAPTPRPASHYSLSSFSVNVSFSFRKSSRKHWMPISCWPMQRQEEGAGGVGGGVCGTAQTVYRNLANRLDKNKAAPTQIAYLFQW